jgi:hypothetical protein
MTEKTISPYKQKLLKDLQLLLNTSRRAAIPFDDHNRCRAAADSIAAAIMAGPDNLDQQSLPVRDGGSEIGSGKGLQSEGQRV